MFRPPSASLLLTRGPGPVTLSLLASKKSFLGGPVGSKTPVDPFHTCNIETYHIIQHLCRVCMCAWFVCVRIIHDTSCLKKSIPFPYIPTIYVQRFLKFSCFASSYISKSSSGPAVLKTQFLNVGGLQAVSSVWKKKKKESVELEITFSFKQNPRLSVCIHTCPHFFFLRHKKKDKMSMIKGKWWWINNDR